MRVHSTGQSIGLLVAFPESEARQHAGYNKSTVKIPIFTFACFIFLFKQERFCDFSLVFAEKRASRMSDFVIFELD